MSSNTWVRGRNACCVTVPLCCLKAMTHRVKNKHDRVLYIKKNVSHKEVWNSSFSCPGQSCYPTGCWSFDHVFPKFQQASAGVHDGLAPVQVRNDHRAT